MPSLPSLPTITLVVVVVVVAGSVDSCPPLARRYSLPVVMHRTLLVHQQRYPQSPPSPRPQGTDDPAIDCLIDVCYLSLDHPYLCQDTLTVLRSRDAVKPCNDTCAAHATGGECRHPIVMQYLLDRYAGLSCGQQWEAIFWSNGSGNNTATTLATTTAATTTATATVTTAASTPATTAPVTSSSRNHQARARDQKAEETRVPTNATDHHNHNNHHHRHKQHHQADNTNASSSSRKQTGGGVGGGGDGGTTPNTRTKAPRRETTKLTEVSRLNFNERRRIPNNDCPPSDSTEGEDIFESAGRKTSHSEADSRRKSVKEVKKRQGNEEGRLKKQEKTRKKEEEETEGEKQQNIEKEKDRERKRTQAKPLDKEKLPEIHIHIQNIHEEPKVNTGFPSVVVVWLSVVVVVAVVVACCGLLAWFLLYGRKRSFHLH